MYTKVYVGDGQHCSLDDENLKTTAKPKVGGAMCSFQKHSWG